MEKYIYNLTFPAFLNEFEIGGYSFSRVNDYENRYLELQHKVESSGSEFQIKRKTGSNQITGIVKKQSEEETAYLKWRDGNAKRLHDIILSLTLATGRDIGLIDPHLVDDDHVMRIGSNIADYGGVLRTSISADMRDVEYMGGKESTDYSRINMARKIMECVSNDEWMKKYENGYFLFLMKSAIFTRKLESAFLQFWTIWEHLYTVLNRDRYAVKTIQNMNSRDKISYLLVEYGLKDSVKKNTQTNIGNLATIRNRLVHFGRFPDCDTVHTDALFFIRLTETIIVKILGLKLSNVFNTLDEIKEF